MRERVLCVSMRVMCVSAHMSTRVHVCAGLVSPPSTA